MTVETTVIATAVALWFAQGWYLNTRLERVHAKLDRALECFDGLRDYLYEIDPQFDEERRLLSELDESLNSEKTSFAGSKPGTDHSLSQAQSIIGAHRSLI
jgi:hypothetical protein